MSHPATKPRTIAPFLTTADVAQYALNHVYRLIHRKRNPLPAHWVGAYLRIDADELRDWFYREQTKAVRR